MDQHQFDVLARTLSSVPTRRDVLRGLAGCGLGLGSLRWPHATEATHFVCRHVGERCKQAGQCCSGICKHHKCRAHDKGICKAGQDSCLAPVVCGAASGVICNCLVTTGKASFCGLNGATPSTCTRDEECLTAKGEGAACVVCGGATYCVARCPVPD